MDNPIDKLFRDKLDSVQYASSHSSWLNAKAGIGLYFKKILIMKIIASAIFISSIGFIGFQILKNDVQSLDAERAQLQLTRITRNTLDKTNHRPNNYMVLATNNIPDDIHKTNNTDKTKSLLYNNTIKPINNSKPVLQIAKKLKKEIETIKEEAEIKETIEIGSIEKAISPIKETIRPSVLNQEVNQVLENIEKPKLVLASENNTLEKDQFDDEKEEASKAPNNYIPKKNKWTFYIGFDALKVKNTIVKEDEFGKSESTWSSQMGLGIKYEVRKNIKLGLGVGYSQLAEKYSYHTTNTIRTVHSYKESYLDTIGYLNMMIWDGKRLCHTSTKYLTEKKDRNAFYSSTHIENNTGVSRNVFHVIELPVSASYSINLNRFSIEPELSANLGFMVKATGFRVKNNKLKPLSSFKLSSYQNGFSPALNLGYKVRSNVGLSARIAYKKQLSPAIYSSSADIQFHEISVGARMWFTF